MSKITKKQLQESHNKLLNQFASLVRELKVNNVIDDSVCPTFTKKTEPKQLDQSVFNNMHERWKFAAVDEDGSAHRFSKEVIPYRGGFCYEGSDYHEFKFSLIGTGYDASNWQNSLIERDIAKELLEVDLSSELTGSDLAKDYFKRGCCPRVCFVGEDDDECLSDLMVAMVIGYVEGKGFETSYHDFFPCAAMINSYGDELTASQVGS